MKLLTITNKYSKDGKILTGFTIIELVVVMAVFLFIIGAAISIFISVVQSQKKVLSEQQLVNQISYTEEYMSKALRMATVDTTGNCLGADNKGYIYLLTRNDSDSSLFRGIKFLNQSDEICQEFFIDNVTPDRTTPLILNDSTNPVVLKELKGLDGLSDSSDIDAVPLTSASLKINFIRFSVNGSNGSSTSCGSSSQCGASNKDTVQPRVTIVFNINVAGDTNEPIRTIQTTVSQRNLNAKQ